MTNTRHEFAAVVHLAEQRDMVVGVNVVGVPSEHGLYQTAGRRAGAARPVVGGERAAPRATPLLALARARDRPPEAEIIGVALRDEGNLIGTRCTIRGVTRAAGEPWRAEEPTPS